MYNNNSIKKNILMIYILCIYIIVLYILSIGYIECRINERKLVSTRTAAFSPIPLPVTGECKAGKKYKVRSIEDLESQVEELECIFAAGLPPYNGQVPKGFSYGYLLTAANTAFWSRAAQLGYQGDFVVTTQCNGRKYDIGWMSIGGLKVGTAVWTSSHLPKHLQLAEGEYPIGNTEGIIMDFTRDFGKICTPEGSENSITLEGFSPFTNSMYPISHYIDMGRVVGIDQADGGIITLNKAFSTSNNSLRTVLIYATKTFDTSIVPPGTKNIDLIVPEGPNKEQIIQFKRPGAEVALNEINLLSSPDLDQLQASTISTFVNGLRTIFPLF